MSERSYSDVDRDLLTPGVLWTWRVKLSNPPKGEVDGRTVPSDRAEVEAGVGQGQTGNTYAMGRHRKTTDMAFWDGRYGSLAADPVVQVGGDVGEVEGLVGQGRVVEGVDGLRRAEHGEPPANSETAKAYAAAAAAARNAT